MIIPDDDWDDYSDVLPEPNSDELEVTLLSYYKFNRDGTIEQLIDNKWILLTEEDFKRET